MGIHKEVRRLFGSSVLNYMIAARTAQGYEHLKTASQEECQEIIARWYQHKEELQSMKMKLHEQGGPEGQETGHLTAKGLMQTRHLPFDERRKLHEERKAIREAERNKIHGGDGKRCPFCSRTSFHKHTPRVVQRDSFMDESIAPYDEHAAFENALRESVTVTSTGDTEGGTPIERAQTINLAELQRGQHPPLSDDQTSHAGVEAGVTENTRSVDAIANTDPAAHNDAVGQTSVERAVNQDLLARQTSPETSLTTLTSASDTPRAENSEDEDMKLAILASKTSLQEEEEKRRAAAEEDAMLEHIKEQSRQEAAHMTQEDRMLEEAKKASLAEAERMKAMQSSQEGSSGDADDEVLKRAIEESLKDTQGA